MTASPPAELNRLGLPDPCLLVLIGPAGAGKTSVAAAFPTSWRLSLDACRGLVADDPGDQEATKDALAVYRAILDGRLARQLPTVVDATNTEGTARAELVSRAHAQGMPAVALTLRAALHTCQQRQHARPASRRVPAEAVARQHAAMPADEQLLAEGFDAVHDAASLNLLGLLIDRAIATPPRGAIQAALGDDLAAVYTPAPGDTDDIGGTLAVAGGTLNLVWIPAEARETWCLAALLPHSTCGACGQRLAGYVACARDLAAVLAGEPDDEPFCPACGRA